VSSLANHKVGPKGNPMSVNNNNPSINRPAAMEPDCDWNRSLVVAARRRDAAQRFVARDDLEPAMPAPPSLGSDDLKLWRGLQPIRQKPHADARVDEIMMQISSELEWRET
jgi:hypothetical protein